MSEQVRFRNAQTGETFTVAADGERRWIPSGAYELEVSPAAREGLAALVGLLREAQVVVEAHAEEYPVARPLLTKINDALAAWLAQEPGEK